MSYTNPTLLAVNDTEARKYLVSRKVDAEKLVQEGLTNQRYVAVKRGFAGSVQVGDTLCASGICAAAYILARWW